MSIRSIAVAGFLAMVAAAATAAAPAVDTRDQFFASLKGLCGARFEGATTFPADGRDDFTGKLLVADFTACSNDEVRVPFLVGEDRSRTWIFTRPAAGLQLKHDHRHPDGTPDEVTMYGGMAQGTGSQWQQSFAADAYTAKLIPAAITNVWTVSLSPDGRTLTYHLERDAKPRFTAVLNRVPAPPTAQATSTSRISIEEAIRRGRTYVAGQDVQLRKCHISRAEYRDSKAASDSYWSIFWTGETNTRDCFAELRVFPDGTVLRVVGY